MVLPWRSISVWKVVSRMETAGVPEDILCEIREQLAMLRSTVDDLMKQNKRKGKEIERLNQMV